MTTTTTRTGQWFEPNNISAEAQTRIFLFPHAGSGSIIYREWQDLLPPAIGAQAVTLPGRHHRRDEVSFEQWDPLVEELLDAVLAEVDDRPFAFFGHCLGAQLAYALTRRMEQEQLPVPSLLAVSGWAPEGFFIPTDEQAGMPEAEMIEWIKKLGSFPASVYDNPEMLALVIPALRADLAVSARYVDDDQRLGCPLISFGGASDPLQEADDAMDSWVHRSETYLGHSEFPGGHFYIDAHARPVTDSVARHLLRIADST